MLRQHFRPWGQLPWVLSKLPPYTWSVLGCLATEDRCVAVWEHFRGSGLTGASMFVEVTEQHSRFAELATQLKHTQRNKLIAIGAPGEECSHPLLDKHENIVGVVDHFIDIAGQDIILDISCFPKRFFFPFVKRLMGAAGIRNLIATYTIPEKYYEGTLAEDHRPLAHLPLFGIETYPEPKSEVAIISVGFVPLGMAELVDPDRHDVEFKFLFPFPPGPPHFQRNWKFVAQLERTLLPRTEPIRVEAQNVSDTFDHILELTNHGVRAAVFAPYGPKTMSLAMCLFAIKAGSPVFYTQPQTYHPQYTSGVKQYNGVPLVYSYCLRLDGRDLYSLQEL